VEMMRRVLLFSAVMLLIGAWMFGAGPAPAFGSCAELPPPGTALKRSDVVFSGVVTTKEALYPSEAKSSGDPVKVAFRVTEVWKGVVLEHATVRMTSSDSGRFMQGEAYIVYAEKSLTGLRIGPCARAIELASADEDLAALGKGKLPPSSPNLADRIRAHPAGMPLLWTGTALAVLAGAVIARVIWRLRQGRRQNARPT